MKLSTNPSKIKIENLLILLKIIKEIVPNIYLIMNIFN
jgi:hypothetical protein